MDLRARIRRRRDAGDDSGVVLSYQAINPAAHVEEPTGRGAVLEQLLDYLDPVFDGALPPDAHVWGPGGAGKSAVATALFEHMSRLLSGSSSVVHTSTRAQTAEAPAFVYVDARRANSVLGLRHAILDAVTEESVPRRGVGADTMAARLAEQFGRPDRIVAVAVDHVSEAGGIGLQAVREAFAPVSESSALVSIGRLPPDKLPVERSPSEHIAVPRYERHALVDVLTARASDGLTTRAVDHDQLRRIGAWADGDAHDALAALFAAADAAEAVGASRIRERDLTDGMDAVPRPSAPLGRVLSLPKNRQLVLRSLIDIDETAADSVDEAAALINDDPTVGLSKGTIKRFLYELADQGIVERVTVSTDDGAGRPPSRLEPRFSVSVFRRLFDLDRS